VPRPLSPTVVWRPQPGPQTDLITCPIEEVFFGGARGGGKTEASIGDWLEHSAKYGENAVGVFFRRKFKQLEEVVARTKVLFKPLGAKYNEQKAEWTMPNGARLKFRYLERDSDAEEYQGHSYTRVYFEETTNFPTPGPINKLRGTLRSAAGVPCGMRLTGNPGGPGHNWVKARYIDPCKAGYRIIEEVFFHPVYGERKSHRVFIPSKISDNALLMTNNPGYLAQLYQSGSEQLVRAWLDGDWDIIDGAFFDEWDEDKHVLPTKIWLPNIPDRAMRFRAFDWGFASPFSVGWYAVSDGTWGLPKYALLKYREWYGASGPNQGLRMNNELIAKGIVEREKYERISYGVADPKIFSHDGGPSVAETMAINKVMFKKGDNKRIPGWGQVRCRLQGQNGRPMIYFLDCCVDTIRTFPVIQHDEDDIEDLDTDGEDHALDETRYACQSRPWLPSPQFGKVNPLHKPIHELTFNEIIERKRLLRKAEENR
jgi:hypothetical protein